MKVDPGTVSARAELVYFESLANPHALQDNLLRQTLAQPVPPITPYPNTLILPYSAMTHSSNNNPADRIVAAVRQAIGPAAEQVLLHRPYIPPTAWDYVKECLDTGWVSSAGAYVSRFEEQLAGFVGCKRAVATVNGSAALEMCLRLAGVEAGDEVICPALTFVATANAVSHCGALPHFVDVSFERLSICPEALGQRLEEVVVRGARGAVNRHTGRRIAVVCLMHCLGHPADLHAIVSVCSHYGITLVEDAAESLGSTYAGKHTGRFGLLSAVSFNGNKILSTGGGGAILTDDEALADRAKHLTSTAKTPHAWESYHDALGWNYRMPNINAALGVAQLEVLSKMIADKRHLAEKYLAAFSDIDGLQFIREPAESHSNYWLNGFVLDSACESHRDVVLETLNSAGYQCRPLWHPMHALPMYANCPRGPLEKTESLVKRTINVPSSAELASKIL